MMNSVLRAYLQTALWASTDDRGVSLDSRFGVYDLSEAFVRESREQLRSFLLEVASAGIDVGDNDLESIAHDFWLTRNRHGAGFWDGAYSEPSGRALTRMAHAYGSVDIVIGDQIAGDHE